jgi:malonate transporter and related proteins
MQSVLAVTVPFFALVLCGYLAARADVLPESAIPGLNGFVLFFALPCLLFRFGSALPVAQVLDPLVGGLYLIGALLMIGCTVYLTRSPRVPMLDASFGALTATFPNTGFMGVPLIPALLGPAAAGPVITMVLVDLLFTSSLAIALSQVGHRGEDGPWRAAQRALSRAVSNPLPWAIALGLVFSALQLKLPGPADTVVRMLADAATPVALFAIGTMLWRASAHARTRTPVALYLPIALAKLLVHPLLIFALGAAALQAGAPISIFAITVMVLGAALPSASTVSLLAERYGADNGRIARIIVSSTVLAFVTFTLIAWGIGVQPQV